MFLKRYNICPYCEAQMKGEIACLQCCKRLKLIINNKTGVTKDCSYFVSPFIYKDFIRDAILNFKFKRNTQFCVSFAHFMSLCKIDSFDVLVCVPTFEADFNPSFEIAKVLKKKINIKFEPDSVQKMRKTKDQHSCGFKERLTNLKKAFVADPVKLEGKRVLICDDVITTTTTIQEVSSACKKAKASFVGAVVFAVSENLF